MEITYVPKKKWYATALLIDPNAAKKDLREYAAKMEQALWAWVREQNIPFEETDIPTESADKEVVKFDRLADVLGNLFFRLRHPETLV